MEHTPTPTLIASKALKWAVSLAPSLPCEESIIEGDSQGCIQAIQNNGINFHQRVKNVLAKIVFLARAIPNLSFSCI